jgi:hypothetical protein
LAECKDHQFEKAQDMAVNAMEGVRQLSTQLTRHLSLGKDGLVNEALVKTDRVFKGELAHQSHKTINQSNANFATMIRVDLADFV